jgi:hypothetical protein
MQTKDTFAAAMEQFRRDFRDDIHARNVTIIKWLVGLMLFQDVVIVAVKLL